MEKGYIIYPASKKTESPKKEEKLIFHDIESISVECFKRFLLGENVWFSEEPMALKRA
jgi:hypothetical protein